MLMIFVKLWMNSTKNWNEVASKMYASAKEQEPEKSTDTSEEKKKDDEEIEDADFEVVD